MTQPCGTWPIAQLVNLSAAGQQSSDFDEITFIERDWFVRVAGRQLINSEYASALIARQVGPLAYRKISGDIDIDHAHSGVVISTANGLPDADHPIPEVCSPTSLLRKAGFPERERRLTATAGPCVSLL